MKFYSVVSKINGNLLWELVEFENYEIAGYSYEYKDIIIYSSLNEFMELEENDDEELIVEGVDEEKEENPAE